tara:strand:- start:507 stop:1313 length:807 start_codon:yes stop_codon:yes gene_type:complete
MPSIKSVSDIKSSLLRPALTSHYLVEIGLPSSGQTGDGAFRSHLKEDGIELTTIRQEKLNLLCSEASLPGSSVATFEINNDYSGTTERHAHRKFFDDRIDFTFYVDVEDYLPIKFFESWIRYVTGSGTTNDNTEKAKTYFYRMNFPDEYTSDQGLTVTKFERDTYKKQSIVNPSDFSGYTATGNGLVYTFIRSFPISITSMPISYEGANLLKCTVSMSYIRYIVEALKDTPGGAVGGSGTGTRPNSSFSALQFLDQNGQLRLGSQNIA